MMDSSAGVLETARVSVVSMIAPITSAQLLEMHRSAPRNFVGSSPLLFWALLSFLMWRLLYFVQVTV